MNILFIAAPAAGKGTQSKLVCDKYNLTHVSTGDLLREVVKKNDSFSNDIKKKMEEGSLISDDIILKLIKEKIQNQNGFVFDGFPRNLKQAEMFDELLNNINQNLDYIIYLDVDQDEAKRRILGRMVCPNCNSVYNIDYDKLDENNYCECGTVLAKRSDDTIETFQKRYEIYQRETVPVIDYYSNKANFYKVNSSVLPDMVFKQIQDIIGE